MLDCFSGSGTTLNVASHLGRRWIGVDNSREAIAATLRRFGKGLELMGDFVNKPSFAVEEEQSSTILPLFQTNNSQKPVPKVRNQHQVIKDFTLLVQEPYRGELHDLLEQWMMWTGEAKVFRLAETPPSYGTRTTKKRVIKKNKGGKITKYVIRRQRGH